MKTRLIFVSLLLTAISFTQATAQQVVDFESLNGFNETSPTGQFFNGFGFNGTAGGFEVDGVSFPSGGEFLTGWSYSQVVDPTTAGFTNQFAAAPGRGADGSATYALAFEDFTGANPSFSSESQILSLDITNTTFTFLSILEGDQFADPFGGDDGTDPDFFSVNINGFDSAGIATGSIEYFLADFRSDDPAEDFAVNTWETVDVSSLDATTLAFDFNGTDTSVIDGQTFLNTPAYLAVDNIVVAIPEPSSLLLIAAAGFAGVLRRRRSIS